MSTPFAAAALHAYRALQVVHGVNITYERPSATQSVALSKVVTGRSDHEITQDGMVIEQVKSRDYLVRVADLVLGGSQTLPRTGDRIQESGKTYAVLTTGTEAQWKYTDPSQVIIRIHTREM
jgi:hypothetical protein